MGNLKERKIQRKHKRKVTSDTSQLEGKKGIGFSVAPPEVTSSPQRSHPKQSSETQILRNFRNTGPKLFKFKVSEIRTQEPSY